MPRLCEQIFLVDKWSVYGIGLLDLDLLLNIVCFIKPRMNKIRPQPAMICRRRFFSSIAGLAASLYIPFLASKVTAKDQDFVIINGWVLTREDVLGSEVTIDVV